MRFPLHLQNLLSFICPLRDFLWNLNQDKWIFPREENDPKLAQKDLIKTHTPPVAAQRSQGIPLLGRGEETADRAKLSVWDKKPLSLTCWHPLSVGPACDQCLLFPLKLSVRTLVPAWLISPLLIVCHLLLSKIFINEAKQRQRWRRCGDKHLCCWDSHWLGHSRGQK